MSSNLVFLLNSEEMKGQFADWADSICLAIKVVGVDHQMEFLIFHENELNNKLTEFSDGLPVVPEVEGFKTSRILFSTETQILRMINEERNFPEWSQEYLMNYNWETDELNNVNDPTIEEVIAESDLPEDQFDSGVEMSPEVSEPPEAIISASELKDDTITLEELYVPELTDEVSSKSDNINGVSFGKYYKTADELINTSFFAKLIDGKLIIASNNSAIQRIDPSLDVLLSEKDYSILLPTNKNLRLELSEEVLENDSNNTYSVGGVTLSYSVMIDCSDIIQTYGNFVGSEFQRVILEQNSLGFEFKLPTIIVGNTSKADEAYQRTDTLFVSNDTNKKSLTNYVSGFVSVLAVVFTVLLYHQVTVSFEKINTTLDQTSINLNKLNGMTELKSDLNPIYLNNMRDKIIESTGDENEN